MKTGTWRGRRFLALGLALLMTGTLSAGAEFSSYAEERAALTADSGAEGSGDPVSGGNHPEGSGDITEDTAADSNTPDNNIPDGVNPDAGIADGSNPDANIPDSSNPDANVPNPDVSGDDSPADDENAAAENGVPADDENHAEEKSSPEETENSKKSESKESGEAAAQSGEELPSGTCGERLAWRLEMNSSGKYTLIIEGSGNMVESYSATNQPWKEYCSAISSVSLPQGLTSIASGAFRSFSGLGYIDIPDSVTKIGSLAFANSGLKEAVISGNVAFLDTSTFNACPNMLKVKICDGVKSIGATCFMNNRALCEIEIPASVETIGKNAFRTCSALKTIYYGGTKEQWDKMIAASDATVGTAINGGNIQIKCEEEMPESVYSIKTDVETMNYNGWVITNETGGTISVSKTEAKRGDSVVVSIKANKGYKVSDFVVMYDKDTVDPFVKEYYVSDGDYKFVMPGDDVAVWVSFRSDKCGPNLTWNMSKNPDSGLYQLTIQGTGEMYYYDAIIHEPWYEMKAEIDSVSLPDGITGLCNNAFLYSTKLGEICLPDSLQSLGDLTFGCAALREVKIPASALSGYSERCFYKCLLLERVEIAEGAEKMDYGLLEGCENLKEIVIPASMSKIGDNVLNECRALRTVYYGGTKQQWKKLAASAGKANDILSSVKVICGYSVTVESDGNGTASANAARAAVGETVKLSASPSKGYRFKKWQVLSGSVKVKNNSFTMQGGAVTLRAVFERLPAAAGNGADQTGQTGTGSGENIPVMNGGAAISNVVNAAAGGLAGNGDARKRDASRGKKKTGEEKAPWFNTGLWSSSSSSQDKAAETAVGAVSAPHVKDRKDSWALLNLLLAVCTAFVSMFLVIGSFAGKRKGYGMGNTGSIQRMSLIPAIASAAVFFLTEDMGGSMVFADRYTWMAGILAIVQGAICILAYPRSGNITDRFS